jgi:bifunctional UDP-N-acetylglucosamine pyrophosphorylase/glucosamine-1-phosphate N-acetyltransferase
VVLSDKETEFSVFILKAERMSEAIDDAIENGSNKILSLKEIQAFTERKSLKVGIFKVIDTNEIKCVSNGIQFSQAAKILRKQILYHFMNSGVTIIDPETTYIDAGVEIGRDTVIYPGTIIEGRTVIGEDCIIGPNSRLVSSYIGNEVEIANSIVKESSIDDKTNIGPFAYLRPESKIGKQVKIGDFVEIKKSTIGDCTKISHLTYVGDAEIGSNVNLGCGVVVVNYDGKNKNKTIVEDNAFIGCNVNLVAPVTVRSNAFVAAGSTITEEVPRDSLAIARSRQILKEGWVNNRKDK